ncbi:hypothetical protein GCM10022222_50380 [Amycolatopsis ultiminotia]|uniref:histidine kinase n=1 Tax=Amycolatopsis ultiminotia TaxID=543629 RepID=A0ABP6X583_9PSEU
MKAVLAKAVDLLPRPLDPIRSIKLKLAILLLVSGGIAFAFFNYRIGWLPPQTTVMAMVVALLTSQILAHGMTRPLREMTAAARAMAKGDYTRRIRATARDEVGSLARAFNQMAADLSTADQQRRELIANVSHELRTPITALNAVLENLVDGVAAADPATLRTALLQTERLGRLVTELLDLSRIDAGTLPLDLADVDLADLLTEVAAEAAAMAAATGRGVRFAVSVSPPGAAVTADRERLYQVVVNLLENAARHSPAGGEVRVHARLQAGEARIEVRDEGPGIPPADRDRVFERFTRGERAPDGGTGLGLAIARWAAELHGGTVEVVDEDPKPPPRTGRDRTDRQDHQDRPGRVRRSGRVRPAVRPAGPDGSGWPDPVSRMVRSGGAVRADGSGGSSEVAGSGWVDPVSRVARLGGAVRADGSGGSSEVAGSGWVDRWGRVDRLGGADGSGRAERGGRSARSSEVAGSDWPDRSGCPDRLDQFERPDRPVAGPGCRIRVTLPA